MGDEKEIICVLGSRKTLKVNSGEVHGCPLRVRTGDGAIALSDCKYCGSFVGVNSE